jgi:two-component system chemotaxis response regulator CheB
VVRRDGARAVVRLTDDEPEHGCRPSCDPLLRSLADSHGPAVLSVVLTGMGRDGLEGCTRVRAAGGGVIVQDRDSSVVWGMPGLIAEAGLAEAILPLDRLAEEIQRRTGPGVRRAA